VNFDFLSPDARRAVITAQKLARARDQPEVELEHVLAALLDLPDVTALLRVSGASP